MHKMRTVGAIFHDGEGGYVCYSPNGIDVPKEILLKLTDTAPNYTEEDFFQAVSDKYEKENQG